MKNELFDIARDLAKPYQPSDKIAAASVAAALRAADGAIHTGVCIDSPCGLGFCAEHAAVASMLKAHQAEIIEAIAVNSRGEVLPPCGRCRQLMLFLTSANQQTRIYISKTETVLLGELLPHQYL